jgi:acyltransferase-like protein
MSLPFGAASTGAPRCEAPEVRRLIDVCVVSSFAYPHAMLIMMRAATPSGFSLGYQPALDGLRAVSIVAVLAHHSHWLSGGYLGVDVFFTLSGFLITALLTEEFARTGTITLRLFYARRALRLLPALLVLVVVCAGTLLATVPEYGPLVLHQAAAVLFYVANWAWVIDVPLGVLSHTWSLGVEEQFYLLWPCALLVMLRVSSPRRLFAMTLVLAGAGAAWRHALVQAGARFEHIQRGLDAHGDALLIGCALSLGLTAGLRLPGRSTLAALAGVCGAGGSPRLLDMARQLHTPPRQLGRGRRRFAHHRSRRECAPLTLDTTAGRSPSRGDRSHFLWRLSVAFPGVRPLRARDASGQRRHGVMDVGRGGLGSQLRRGRAVICDRRTPGARPEAHAAAPRQRADIAARLGAVRVEESRARVDIVEPLASQRRSHPTTA